MAGFVDRGVESSLFLRPKLAHDLSAGEQRADAPADSLISRQTVVLPELESIDSKQRHFRQPKNIVPIEVSRFVETGSRVFRFFPGIGATDGARWGEKDFLTFVREPAQWVQFTLVFGLLIIYASGLNQIHDQLTEPRDLYIVAFLNMTVSALALSTLTTRFVFPQFSLEGQRLWILTMSPIKLTGIVIQKFVTSTVMTGIAVTIILLISSHNLRFKGADTLFFSGSIFFLSIGLNAIAVGLGVLFPNLRESNTAKNREWFWRDALPGGELRFYHRICHHVGFHPVRNLLPKRGE